jgi:hypothetical protein
VANENHRTAMRRENALGYGHIIRERYCGILNYADCVAAFLKDFIDFFPTRAIHESAMDENYCLYSRISYSSHTEFLSLLLFVLSFNQR